MKPAILMPLLFLFFRNCLAQLGLNDTTKFYSKNHNFYINTGVSMGVAKEIRTFNSGKQQSTNVLNFNSSLQLGYLKGLGNQAYGGNIGYYNHVFYNMGILTLAADYRRFLSKNETKGLYVIGQAGAATVLHNYKYIKPSLGYHFYGGVGYTRKYRRWITSFSMGLQITQADHTERRYVDDLGTLIYPEKKTVLGLRRLDLLRCELLF